jgi:hypothetical protein
VRTSDGYLETPEFGTSTASLHKRSPEVLSTLGCGGIELATCQATVDAIARLGPVGRMTGMVVGVRGIPTRRHVHGARSEPVRPGLYAPEEHETEQQGNKPFRQGMTRRHGFAKLGPRETPRNIVDLARASLSLHEPFPLY